MPMCLDEAGRAKFCEYRAEKNPYSPIRIGPGGAGAPRGRATRNPNPQYAIDAKDDLCTRFLRRLGRPRLRRREPSSFFLLPAIRGPDLLDLGVGF